MPLREPVHIIGAGLIGLSTADSLMDRGREVIIWDAAPAPGMGASFANSALLHPSQAAPWLIEGYSDEMTDAERDNVTREGLELSGRSTERIKARMEQMGLPPDRRGLIQIFANDAARDDRLSAYARFGVRAERANWMGHPAVDIPEDSAADARAYTRSLAEDLVGRGAEFRMGHAVALHFGEGGQVCITPQHGRDVCVDELVVAAGHETGRLLVPLGLDLDLEGVEGHALRFRRTDAIGDTPVMDATSRSALTVLDNEIRISGSVGLASPDDLLPLWSELSPALVELLGPPVGRWTGKRPVSRNGRPYMGGTDVAGLFVNAGHAHMGWTLSAGAGELVADAVMAAR